MTTATLATTKPTLPRRRNARGEGGLLRGELISAAMRLLDRAPVAELSLRMVAKEAGVAAPSVYPHFEDVTALMTEIVRDCWRQLGSEMAAAAALCQGDDPFVTLKAQLAAYIRYAMARPSRYQLLFALPPLDVEALRDLPGVVQPAFRNVMETLERYVVGGALPAVDLVDSTIFILSLTHGRIALAQTAPHRPGNSPQGVQDSVFAMLDRVFAA